MVEIEGAIVVAPSAVGIKPHTVIPPSELLELAREFGELAGDFLIGTLSFIASHQIHYTPDKTFLPRKIQQPFLHAGPIVDGSATDFTDKFAPTDTIRCTALVHDAKGSTIRVRWRLGRRKTDMGSVTPDENGEKRMTVSKEPDTTAGFPLGRGKFEWSVDGDLAWDVPFEVVPDRAPRDAIG